MVKISREKLESLIAEAIENLPDELKDKLENIDISIEDAPPSKNNKGLVLGLYQGIPLNKRGFWYGNVLPDKITLFKNNIELLCNSENDIINVVKDVVIHELAHYFGFDEKQIRESGY